MFEYLRFAEVCVIAIGAAIGAVAFAIGLLAMRAACKVAVSVEDNYPRIRLPR
jgi:hypothetical protein